MCSAFRAFFSRGPATALSSDYALVGDLGGGAYAAYSRDGSPTLILPLHSIPNGAAGIQAAGCELIPHSEVRLEEPSSTRDGPVAALKCTEQNLLPTFSVLVEDVLRRTPPTSAWRNVTAVVNDWLMLLKPRGQPSAERELGLWGELWFIARSDDVGRIVASWRGPEQDTSDFFLGNRAVEVKTSRTRQRHFVSQSQVDAPAGDAAAWLLSIWVKVDPVETAKTVPELVDSILERASDPADALRRVARAGYSPGDRTAYQLRLAVLEEPGWFPVANVPRVRAVDPGVSNLRYQVSLDDGTRLTLDDAKMLWMHFHQQSFPLSP